MNTHTPPKRTGIAPAILTFALLCVSLPAQEGEEEVFELSPFVVDASEDIGYAAQNTLSGSRLNTNLKDVASPLEVFTKEFLDDISATTIEDAFAYHSNAQEDLGDENASMQQDYKMQAQVRTRFKVRGLSQTRARDYFHYGMPIDLFSTERVDASRGPNSILFGVGNAGGVANVSTKKAHLNRNATSVGIRVGDDSHLRFTLDHNQVLLDDKLAFRLNLLDQDGRNWYAHGRNEKEGIHLATTFRPRNGTTIRAEYEYGTKGDMATRTFPVETQAYYWDLAGRPTFDPTAVSNNNQIGALPEANLTLANENTGVESSQRIVDRPGNNNADRFYWIENDGGMFYSTTNRVIPRNRGLQQLPKDVIYGTMINGPSARRDLTYKAYSAFLEHQIGENMFVELAANHWDSNWHGLNFGNEAKLLGEASTLFYRDAPSSIIVPGADIVNTIDHGYEGLYYYEDAPRPERRYSDNDNLRATISYELDTDRFGDHRFAAMVSTNSSNRGVEVDESRVLTDANGNLLAKPEAGANRLYVRHYVTNESDPADFRNADVTNLPSSVVDPFTGRTLQTGYARISDTYSESGLDSSLLAMQNFWLNRKLVTTFGYRIDDSTTKSFGTDIRDENGLPTGDRFRDPNTNQIMTNLDDLDRDVESQSKTSTIGAIYHLHDNVSLTYNKSSNSGPPFGGWGAPNTSQPIDVSTLTGTADYEPLIPKGDGEDYGLKFNLMDNKIYLTANYFKTSGTGTLTWTDSGLDNRFADIVRALAGDQGFHNSEERGFIADGEIGLLQFDGNGDLIETLVDDGAGNMIPSGIPDYQVISHLIPEGMPRPGFTARDDDFESQGYEMNLTANLTKNISIRAGYSYTTRRVFQRWNSARVFSDKVREWAFSGRDFDASLLERLPVRRIGTLGEAHEAGAESFIQDSEDRYLLTVADVLDYDINEAINIQTENAQQGFGQRHHKANIWASYKFKEGALEGLSIFGGIRYQSGAQAGYRYVIDENNVYRQDKSIIEETGSRMNNDIGFAYQTKANWIKDGATIRFQLNVKNVFNDDDYDVSRLRTDPWGNLVNFRYYVPTPRQTNFSATIRF